MKRKGGMELVTIWTGAGAAKSCWEACRDHPEQAMEGEDYFVVADAHVGSGWCSLALLQGLPKAARLDM